MPRRTVEGPRYFAGFLWERVFDKIQVPAEGDCWEWIGSKVPEGYGHVWADGRIQRAHRVVYEIVVGPIPEGLTLDHLCHNRPCVNPDHLVPATMRDNVLRSDSVTAINSRKTHCPEGHPLSGSNLRLEQGRCGIQRRCRECQNAGKRRRYAARHAR